MSTKNLHSLSYRPGIFAHNLSCANCYPDGLNEFLGWYGRTSTIDPFISTVPAATNFTACWTVANVTFGQNPLLTCIRFTIFAPNFSNSFRIILHVTPMGNPPRKIERRVILATRSRFFSATTFHGRTSTGCPLIEILPLLNKNCASSGDPRQTLGYDLWRLTSLLIKLQPRSESFFCRATSVISDGNPGRNTF